MKPTTLTACFIGLTMALASPALVLAQSASPTVQKTVLKQATNKKVTGKKVSSAGFAPQSEQMKELALQFKSGQFNCEFNNSLTIVPHKDHAGYLTLTHKGIAAQMLPIPTNTGALRLEGKASGLVWLQLPTKSMLMNSKIGQRLADECHAAN